jgi:hypothetical protein
LTKDSPKKELDSFLAANQFHLVERQSDPKVFGNFLETWHSGSLHVRLVQDRSQQFIDIASTEDHKWHDLALVKCLLEGDLDLHTPFEIAEAVAWFKLHFLEMQALFAGKNYQETKKRLETLGRIRAKKLFPGL